MKLKLYSHEPDSPNQGKWLLWQGHCNAEDCISIEKRLSQNLTAIRDEHMAWAYETGKLKSSNLQTLADGLICGANPSMWWTSLIYERHPRLSPWLYEAYKLRQLELELESANCDNLIYAGRDKKLAAILGKLCEARKITFAWENTGPKENVVKPPLKIRLYNAIPGQARALARFGHWLWTVKRYLPAAGKLAPANGRTATIATYFPNIDLNKAKKGRFHSRYWESLHDALNQQANREGSHFCRWLFIRFPAPDLSLKNCVALKKKFQKTGLDGLSFNYLEEFMGAREIFLGFARWLKLSLASYRQGSDLAKNACFPNSRLNLWPLMRKQWAESTRGWRALERCLQNEAFIKYCQMAGKQRWTLFPLENCPWERMLVEHSHAICGSGPVFGAQHSTIRPTDFRYFDDARTFTDNQCAPFQPDKIAANGNSAFMQWQANSLPKERLMKVEALRYLYLNSMPKTETRPTKSLLVLTSFFQDETDAHLRLLREALEAGIFKDWELFIKPHPYLSVQYWLDSLPADMAKPKLLTCALAEALAQAACVWTSNSTTTSLEAAWLGLPLMVMGPSNDFDLCPIQDIPELKRTSTLNDVKKAIANPGPVKIPPGYLDLNPALPGWRKLLGLAETN